MLPRIQAISTFSRAQKVSIAALSNASPVDPNESCMPALPAAKAKSSDVYCEPSSA